MIRVSGRRASIETEFALHRFLTLIYVAMQAGFSAFARIVVRELRKTETTDIIMVYSGTMHCALSLIACLVIPGSVVILQHAWQVATLLLTGIASSHQSQHAFLNEL